MSLRVSAVQYHLHTIQSFYEFAKQVDHYIKTAKEHSSDFVLFPEFFTTQLLSIGNENENGEAMSIEELSNFTEQYRSLFRDLAMRTNMHIIAGTHVIKKEGNYIMLLIYFTLMDELQNSRSFILPKQKFMNGILVRVKSCKYSRRIKEPLL